MKFNKYLLFCTFALFGLMFQQAYSQDEGHEDHNDELNEKDTKALREFLASQRAKDLVSTEKGHLAITGDIRFEWRHLNEKVHGQQIRGGKCSRDCDGVPLSRNDFDIEANIWLAFDYCKAWAVANLQFDNPAGTSDNNCCCDFEKCRSSKEAEDDCTLHRFHGSGRCDKLCLKRAYMGYTLLEFCGGKLDAEIGRRRLYDIFESDIEFLSRFDGLLLKYSNSFDQITDWYWKWGGFVVDERVNQFAWATEAAVFNICDTGFDLKYSFINWAHKGRSRCGGRNPSGFKYRISQLLMNYNVDEDLLSTPFLVYGAVLYNHTANQARTQQDIFKHHKRKDQGFGCYAGVLLGEVEDKGDWSVELEYQYVEDHAIPFDDESGIGLGNFLEDCCGKHFLSTGYQGWSVEFLYAITDNLVINAIGETARSTERRNHTYSKVELELVYSF